jgi:cation diffusion facilitator CzcD-associated flavoprotein CzcO
MVGNGSSAEDISRDIAQVAKEVHISGRTWDMWSSWNRSEFVDFSKPRGPYGNIWLHSTVRTKGPF